MGRWSNNLISNGWCVGQLDDFSAPWVAISGTPVEGKDSCGSLWPLRLWSLERRLHTALWRTCSAGRKLSFQKGQWIPCYVRSPWPCTPISCIDSLSNQGSPWGDDFIWFHWSYQRVEAGIHHLCTRPHDMTGTLTEVPWPKHRHILTNAIVCKEAEMGNKYVIHPYIRLFFVIMIVIVKKYLPWLIVTFLGFRVQSPSFSAAQGRLSKIGDMTGDDAYDHRDNVPSVERFNTKQEICLCKRNEVNLFHTKLKCYVTKIESKLSQQISQLLSTRDIWTKLPSTWRMSFYQGLYLATKSWEDSVLSFSTATKKRSKDRMQADWYTFVQCLLCDPKIAFVS